MRLFRRSLLCLVVGVTAFGADAQPEASKPLDLTDAARHEILRAGLTHVRREYGVFAPLTGGTRVQADAVLLADIPGFAIAPAAGRTFFEKAEAGVNEQAMVRRLKLPGKPWSLPRIKNGPVVLPKDKIRENAGHSFIVRLTDVLVLTPTESVLGVFVEQGGRARAECFVRLRLREKRWQAVVSIDAQTFSAPLSNLVAQKSVACAAIDWFLSEGTWDMPTKAGQHWRICDQTLDWDAGVFGPSSAIAVAPKWIDKELYQTHIRDNARIARVGPIASRLFEFKPIAHLAAR